MDAADSAREGTENVGQKRQIDVIGTSCKLMDSGAAFEGVRGGMMMLFLTGVATNVDILAGPV